MPDIYTKIEYYRKIRGIPKMKFYELLSLTQAGYRNMVASDTINKNTMITAAEVLRVPLFTLLEEEQKKVLETLISEQTKTNWQVPSYVDTSLMDEIILSDLPIQEKFILISEKIKHLTMQLKISDALAEVRRKKIEQSEGSKK
jgi:hypothetical protein